MSLKRGGLTEESLDHWHHTLQDAAGRSLGAEAYPSWRLTAFNGGNDFCWVRAPKIKGRAKPTYIGTPEIGPGPRLFSSDFTPGKDLAAVSAAAAWLAFSTTPQSRTSPSLTMTFTRAVSSSRFPSRIWTISSRSCRSFAAPGS